MTVGPGPIYGHGLAAAAAMVATFALRRSLLQGRARERLNGVGASESASAGPTHARSSPDGGVVRRLMTPGRLLGSVAGLFLVLRMAGPVPIAAVATFAGVWWWARRTKQQQNASAALARELPEVLDGMVGTLRGGGGLLDAVRRAHSLPLDAVVRDEIGRVLKEVDSGGSVSTALRSWAVRSDERDLVTAVALVESGLRTGGPVADALAGVAANVRARQAQAREVTALVAQSRLSAMVLVVLPIGVMPLLQMLGVTSVATILADPVGRVGLIVGVLLDLVGLWWMRRLIDRIDR